MHVLYHDHQLPIKIQRENTSCIYILSVFSFVYIVTCYYQPVLQILVQYSDPHFNSQFKIFHFGAIVKSVKFSNLLKLHTGLVVSIGTNPTFKVFFHRPYKRRHLWINLPCAVRKEELIVCGHSLRLRSTTQILMTYG